jgi:valyl-tRNA synthetase
MHDWCVSRQLWWGHRIPVWYGPDGEVVCVGPDDDVPTGPGWHQDPDVLDTWFSSALWPFSTLGWPDDAPALAKFYPNQVLVTGYDILFFWVARMMMFGLYARADQPPADAVPFRTVALHGMVRDEHGKKMSKSFGNAVDPIEWLDRFGADAVRFTLARGANPGTDVPVGADWVQASRNFCNKLWNATRFALLNGAHVGALPPVADLSAPDRWILSRLNATAAAVDAFYEDFQFAKLSEALFHFVWDEFCDWYVELAKSPLAAGGAAAERTRLVLGHVLDTVLRLLHPLIPFVTEKLWTTLTGEESVVIANWPRADDSLVDAAAETAVDEIQRLVTEVRRFRSDQGLKPRQRVTARLVGPAGGSADTHEIEIRSLTWLGEPAEGFAPTASLQVGSVLVEIDVSGSIDLGAERRRTEKDLAAARNELAQAAAKLDNEQFLAKAPDAVVTRIRERRTAAEAEIARLEARLAVIGG